FAQGKSQNDVFQRFPDLETWVFHAKIGSISHAVPSEAGWYVYQILDRRKAGLRPLDAVEAEARKAAVRSLEMQGASAAAEQARAALMTGGKPDAVAKQFRGVAGRAEGVTRNGFIGPLGQDARMAGQLMATPAGTWSNVLTGLPGAAVFHVDGHTVP